jgi:hypothetical protein
MQSKAADPRIKMTYQPQNAPLVFAAYPGGLHFVLNGPGGRLLSRNVHEGETIEILEGFSLRVNGFSTHAVADVKPFVVPPPQQQANVGQTFSMARVEVQTARGVESKWVRFSAYVLPDEQHVYAGRFAFAPEVFRTEDGGLAEVVLSRKRLALPNPIAMEDFTLDTHAGGYTGNTLTIRNYVSRLRFLDQGKWTEPTSMAVNSPTEYGGYWYFQSTWDRPDQNAAGAGMNYTGLGIGNRHGVHVQLLGCCVAVAGMIFAFYIKPVLKRRRVAQSRARTSHSAEEVIAVVPSMSLNLESTVG